jgi:hypothetical protein
MTTSLLAGAFLTGLLQGPLPADTRTPTAEEVLDRHVEVTGGAEAYARIDYRVSRGTVQYESLGTLTALTLYETRTTARLMRTRSESLGDQEEGSFGDVAWTWSHMAGPRVLKRGSLRHALRAAPLDAPVRWRELFARAEYVGEEELEGKRIHVVRLVPEKGKSEKRSYDAETGRLVRTEGHAELEGNFMPAVSTYSDYREVDGVLLPHRSGHSIGNLHEVVFRLTTVEHPEELPVSVFEPPPPVQALLGR